MKRHGRKLHRALAFALQSLGVVVLICVDAETALASMDSAQGPRHARPRR